MLINTSVERLSLCCYAIHEVKPRASGESIRFIELNQLLLDLRADNRTIFDINTAEEAQLLDIAESGTKTSYKAQAILYAARGTDFSVVLPALASGGDNWYSSFKGVNSKISELYPNPAQNNVGFSHHLQMGETGTLQIISLVGKEMDRYVFNGEGNKSIDISHLQTGLYFCIFGVNGSKIHSTKLSVIK